MDFVITAVVTINNDELLAIVNDFQNEFDLEEFTDISECPVELILMSYEYFDELDNFIGDYDTLFETFIVL